MERQSRILIVDDTPDNIQLLGGYLKDRYDLGVAMDGAEALNAVAKNQYDLILLDIMMPGIDGFEVCRRIRSDERLDHVPIIFLTAKNDKKTVVDGLKLGAQDYLVKPFDRQTIIDRVAHHLKTSPVREGGQTDESANPATATDSAADLKHAVSAIRDYVASELRDLRIAKLDLNGLLAELGSERERLRSLLEQTAALLQAALHREGSETGPLAEATSHMRNEMRKLDRKSDLEERLADAFESINAIKESIGTMASALEMNAIRPPERFRLGRILDQILDNTALPDNVAIHRELMDDEDIRGSKNLVKPILDQLLSNSLQARAVSTRNRLISIRTSVKNGVVLWTWEDDGIGPDHLSKVGTPFTSTKAGHAGVGLAMVKKWVETNFNAAIQWTETKTEAFRITISIPVASE